MKKQEFTFEFPMSGDITIKKLNPLAIKETAISYLDKQSIIRGDICIIKDAKGEVIAVACYAGEHNDDIKFFTEDESINDITTIEEVSNG